MKDYKRFDTGNKNLSLLLKAVRELIQEEQDKDICLNMIPCMVMFFMERINWAGFYILKGDELVIGPFQGKIPCTRIEIGKGVCGTAALRGESQLVRDVHSFEGHIACDSDTSSELVVPIFYKDRLFGVIDLDSPEIGRFGEAERDAFESIAEMIGQMPGLNK